MERENLNESKSFFLPAVEKFILRGVGVFIESISEQDFELQIKEIEVKLSQKNVVKFQFVHRTEFEFLDKVY